MVPSFHRFNLLVTWYSTRRHDALTNQLPHKTVILPVYLKCNVYGEITNDYLVTRAFWFSPSLWAQNRRESLLNVGSSTNCPDKVTLCARLCCLCLLRALIALQDVICVFDGVKRHRHFFCVWKRAAPSTLSVSASLSALDVDGFVTMAPVHVLT